MTIHVAGYVDSQKPVLSYWHDSIKFHVIQNIRDIVRYLINLINFITSFMSSLRFTGSAKNNSPSFPAVFCCMLGLIMTREYFTSFNSVAIVRLHVKRALSDFYLPCGVLCAFWCFFFTWHSQHMTKPSEASLFFLIILPSRNTRTHFPGG